MSKIETIKSLIAEKGVTLRKVAERCGIDYANLSGALNGRKKVVREDKLDLALQYLIEVNTNDIVTALKSGQNNTDGIPSKNARK